jgi:NAD(P)-dependent dehydrogenase (short-subunit alcohol dehydrogenase family)
MDLGVRDRGYLIVEGTAGMGLAAAHVLAGGGARIAVTGRDPDRAGAAESIAPQGGSAVTIVDDVNNDGGGGGCIVDQAVEALGGELSGVAVATGTNLAAHADLEHASDEVWAAAFEDLLMDTVRTVRAAVPHLVHRGGGTVDTTAAHSIRAYRPARLSHVTLKSGGAVFTKTVAWPYGPSGVRANYVCPGAIETDALAAVRTALAHERLVPPEGLLETVMAEEWHMDAAFGRPGRPEEVGSCSPSCCRRALTTSPGRSSTSMAAPNSDPCGRVDPQMNRSYR